MTRARRPRWSTLGIVAVAAALGILAVPLILWFAFPALPGRLESRDGFHWAAAEAGSGRPLLLREQFDDRQVVAGSTRYGIPAGEPVRCYDGDAAPLREAAKAAGRIEELALRTGLFHVLSVSFDDLGGDATTYVYRCGADGAQPLLSWAAVPKFGLRGFALAWLVWTAGWAIALGLVRRSAATGDLPSRYCPRHWAPRQRMSFVTSQAKRSRLLSFFRSTT
ncbi:MAG TPA: hypothetical protein VHN14_07885 [Kofleriaceae bacterium]|nr:hypothetical protein [Kofleriaceae bacterium]